MPRRVKGNDLDAMERATALAGHPFRWTVENRARAEDHYRGMGGPPSAEPETDDQWLASRAFWFNSDGRLTRGKQPEWIGETYIGGSTKRAGDVNQ